MTDASVPDTPETAIDVEQVRSPVSGVDSAVDAGADLYKTARSLFVRRTRRKVRIEFPAYLLVQLSWFMAFGLQMVLFPYLITDEKYLHLDGLALGLANVAMSAPSVVFLLLGGVVAERADGKKLIILLHLMAAIPAILLSLSLSHGYLSYPVIIAYGLALGTVGAFMMPARDAIVNEIVDRRIRTGSSVTLQLGVTLATMAQFIAQVIGLTLGGYADKATTMPGWLGGFTIGPIDSWRLLLVQGSMVAIGAGIALFLARGKKITTGRTGRGAAMGDIADGFKTVYADKNLWGMTCLMFGVGIFVMGSFLVILPLINRDLYGLGSDGIRDMYVTFWLGAFVASVALAGFKYIKRQGRLMLAAQLIGCSVVLTILLKPPHWVFLSIVFTWGIAAGITIAMSRSIVQDGAPKDQLARVLSIYQLGFMAGAPLGAFMIGFLADFFPGEPQKVAFVPAFGMLGLIIWMILKTPIWNMKAERPKE